MSKSLLTWLTALAISVLSIALMLSRWYALGPEIIGTPGTSAWLVRLEMNGELLGPNAYIKLALPPDFRHQHILAEQFDSKSLTHKMRRSRGGGTRSVNWTSRLPVSTPAHFQLVYSFQIITGMRRPTPGMNQRSRILDAAPASGRHLKAGPLIESDHEAIGQFARSRHDVGDDAGNQIKDWYEQISAFSVGHAVSALECLRQRAGSPAGKARLLVACCRNQSIPARLVCGLQASIHGRQKPHYWAEIYTGNHWLPVDPAMRRMGPELRSDDYIILGFNDNLVRHERSRGDAEWTVQAIDFSSGQDQQGPPSWARRAWRRMSLTNLRPEEQAWMSFLVLLPLAALVVSFFRTVIGITTYGTFGPALLGLVCRDLRDFPWALGAFVAIMLIGWWLRRLLDHLHLLMVPRISVILTAIIMMLIAAAMLFQPYASTARGYIALLPLIILTHMIERFWTVEAEDGPAESFRILMATVVVAVAVALVVNIDVVAGACLALFGSSTFVTPGIVRTFLFRFPEALGLCLVGQLLLGRYTGYRLTELWRFQELLSETNFPGDDHESAGASPAAQENGHSGHESP